MEAELLAGDLGQQVMIQQGDECLLRLGEGTAGERGRGQQAEAGARTDAKPPEELLVVGLQRTVGQIEGGDHLWGVEGRHARIAEPRRGVRQFVDQAAEAGRAIPRDRPAVSWIASGSRPLNFTAAAIWSASAARLSPTIRRNNVMASSTRRTSRVSERPPRSGSLRRVVIRIRDRLSHRQERADLIMPGRVVQDHDGAPPAQVSPPQRGALAGGFRYLRGRHGQHLEQTVQRLGRVERGATGIVGMKVEVEHPVRVLPGDQAGRADRQRGLSHARHALDDGDPRDAALLPGERGELFVAAHESAVSGGRVSGGAAPAGRPPEGLTASPESRLRMR